jgi:hypothetical protein
MKGHRVSRLVLGVLIATLLALLSGATSLGQGPTDGTAGPLARGSYENGIMTWTPLVENAGLVLTVTGPEGFYWQQQFAAGASAVFKAVDALGNPLPDGQYIFELRIIAAQTAATTDQTKRGLTSADGAEAQSGSLAVADGALVSPNESEGGVQPLDVVHADDVIIQSSLCVGFDCLADGTESFGFDTVRLKENNLQIAFDDTSSTAGFPANDWRIRANDSASGGASYLAIDDVTGSKVPFKVMAGARTNAIFVSSTGRVGLGTATPILDLHIVRGDTPSIRLDQDTSSGWTPQVWDIAANESNFFVRDTTGGSKLPFRIQPGAPTNSLTVMADGKVGMGTWSPTYDAEVARTGADATLAVNRTDGATGKLGAQSDKVAVGSATNHALSLITNNTARVTIDTAGKVGIGTTAPTYNLETVSTGANATLAVRRTDGATGGIIGGTAISVGSFTNAALRLITNNAQRVYITGGGNVGIANNSPTHLLDVGASGAYCNGGAWVDGSSITFKTNVKDLTTEAALAALMALKPVRYTYTANPNEEYLGFIAEDVPALVAMADRKGLAPMDIVAVLTSVVQEQQQTITDLEARLAALEKLAAAQ